jgi:hypothetical protein
VVQKKDRALCRRIVEESLVVDLAYGTNVAPTILSADEYRQNQEYEDAFLVHREDTIHCFFGFHREHHFLRASIVSL